MSDMTSAQLKKQMRVLADRQVRALTAEYRRDASDKIQQSVRDVIAAFGFRRVFLYCATAFEVQTKSLIEYCLERAIEVALPVCLESGQLAFYPTATACPKPGRYGIPAPEPVGEPLLPRPHDLIVTPGAAFAKNGTRLGRGAGYYDGFLKGIASLKVGVCFDTVLFDSLPAEMYDIPVDMIVTETGVKTIDVG